MQFEKLLESTEDFVEGFEVGQTDLLQFMLQNCSDEIRQEITDLQRKYNNACVKKLLSAKTTVAKTVSA